MNEEEKPINDYVLRLRGKVSLLEPLLRSHNYKVSVEGSITEITDKDNDDGTYNRFYLLEPVRVEVVSPLGETIRAKDPRSKSKLLRAALYREWKDSNSELNDEDFYNLIMDFILRHSSEIVEKALLEK